MRITDIAWTSGPDGDELAARAYPAGLKGEALPVWFRIAPGGGPRRVAADPFVAGFLTPCMHEGEDLHIEAPVSPKLLAATDTIQSIITAWYPDFHRISLTCEGTYEPGEGRSDTRGVGTCFSGGVDSWYTFLKHEASVSHLILIQGLDIRGDNAALWEETKRRCQAVAAGRGKALVTVETNLREVADKTRCPWGKKPARGFYLLAYLACPLAAVGLALQDAIGCVFVASGSTWVDLRPWGCHPLLDPLWSTESLEVIHDGCEANRTQKCAAVARHPDALAHLRVCLDNVPGAYNCGRCLKCYRTMAGLRAFGVLGQAPTFPQGLDLRRLRRMVVPSFDRPFWEPVLAAALAAGDRDLAKALQVVLGKRFSWHRWLRTNRQRLGRLAGRLSRQAGRRGASDGTIRVSSAV